MVIIYQQMLRIGIMSIVLTVFALADAGADVVTDWNERAGEIVVSAQMGPLPAERVLAMVQASVYEAVNAITRRYPVTDLELEAASGASMEAAVAAANHAVLTELVPSHRSAVDRLYQTALAAIADGAAKVGGVVVGEQAAAAILARRTHDGAETGESYRPSTNAGTYVPTVVPETPQWRYRRPWLMTGPAQFRPGPPRS
ncbi:MAG: hypothetical protein OEY28_04630 [Nitrospira sp.]|nr:hypothetical protein [Nitrospira sp.]